MRKMSARKLALCAMIAAIYAAVCLALAPISYGMLQVRAAEALTLLPVYSTPAVWGVTLGCAISNLIGFLTGANPLVLDVYVGTAATCLAALCSRALRKYTIRGLPVLSAVPPVLVNVIVIGLELCFLETGGFSWNVFLLNALYIGAGQAIACFGLGLPLIYILNKTGIAHKYLAGLSADYL